MTTGMADTGTGTRDTFPKLLAERARTGADQPAYREKELGIWQTYGWGHVAAQVRLLAAGLADLGFRRGDRLIVVGDAAMSPYEVTHPGGANEHWNPEAGQVWLARACQQWPKHLWINPVPEAHWGYTQSVKLIKQLMNDRMYPLTLEGLDDAMRELSRKHGQ